MSKTEVYSWRVDPELKSAIEHAARAENTSVAKLLDRIVLQWIEQERSVEGEEEQQRLHAAAQTCFGTLLHGDPNLATQAKTRVRSTLRDRHARQRAH